MQESSRFDRSNGNFGNELEIRWTRPFEETELNGENGLRKIPCLSYSDLIPLDDSFPSLVDVLLELLDDLSFLDGDLGERLDV